MKKILIWIGAIVAGAIVVTYLVCVFFLGSLVTKGVNRYGPSIMHVPLKLEMARLSPFSGEGTLSGLLIANPPGWEGDRAVAIGSIHIAVVPSSIFGDHIVVKEVEIKKPQFVYETKVVSSNIGDLLKGMNEAESSGATGQATTKSGRPMKFEVRHLTLIDGTITLGVGPAAIKLPMPPISLTDLGTREGGITSDQLALAVMRSVASNIAGTTAQAVGKLGSTMGAAATSKFKSLFGH